MNSPIVAAVSKDLQTNSDRYVIAAPQILKSDDPHLRLGESHSATYGGAEKIRSGWSQEKYPTNACQGPLRTAEHRIAHGVASF